MQNPAANMFRDLAVQVNQSGHAANLIRQNRQLVRDLLLNWQPMQPVQ